MKEVTAAETKSESAGVTDAPTATGKEETEQQNKHSEEARPVAHSCPPLNIWDNNKNNQNAFDAFGEYMSLLFKKAEVYEEELQIRQNQQNLQLNIDKTRYVTSGRNNMPLTTEGGGSTSSEANNIGGKINGAAVDETNSKNVTQQLKEDHLLVKADQDHWHKNQAVENESLSVLEVVDESKKEWREQWEVFVEKKKKKRFKEVAIQNLVVPLSVDEFYHRVLDDNATHSIGKFMRDIGELGVNTSSWQPSQTPTPTKPRKRTIQYTHLVSAPMAPPTAKARKQQSLHKFGSIGLCLESYTVVEEVPMADCFVVDDRLWVHEMEDENDGCNVAVTFQVRFVKGTMFRRIIEITTTREYRSFWSHFADMVRSLKESSSLEQKETAEMAVELEDTAAILEGRKTPWGTVLSRIRTSSRRLPGLATCSPRSKKNMASLKAMEERQGINIVQRVVAAFLDDFSSFGKQLSESGHSLAVACAVIFSLVLLNILALKQMLMMNRLLRDLDASLEKMNAIHDVLLFTHECHL